MRQGKDESGQKDAHRTVEVQIKKQAVAAHQIDDPDGRHDGGRKQRRQKEHLECTASASARHRDGIGHHKAQHGRRQSHDGPHDNRIADGPQVVRR